MTEFGLVLTRGPAAELHERQIPDPAEPVVWWHEVTSPALVLGSSQDIGSVDVDACRAAGVDVIRRRSGGGAVLLIPGEVVWFDVIVPVDLVTETADVRRSMVWLGQIVRAVLGVGTVHDGGLVSTAWSKLICFDGIGPGEILVDRFDAGPGDGHGGGRAKLVGISQRRTREAARFQVCWHTSYDPAALPALMRPEHRPPLDVLRPVATMKLGRAAALPGLLRDRLSNVPRPR